LVGECGNVRQFNSSSRSRISLPLVSRALQTSQFGLWILSRDNRRHFNFTTTSQDSVRSPQGVLRLKWRELFFEAAGRIMPQAEGVVSMKLS
jgi:hypothetical protein